MGFTLIYSVSTQIDILEVNDDTVFCNVLSCRFSRFDEYHCMVHASTQAETLPYPAIDVIRQPHGERRRVNTAVRRKTVQGDVGFLLVVVIYSAPEPSCLLVKGLSFIFIPIIQNKNQAVLERCRK